MKKFLAMLLVLALCLSMAACGGDGNKETQGSGSTDPVAGGTVNIPITDDPTTLQGWMMRNSNESVIVPAIYETLLKYDKTGKPQPYLLESFVADADVHGAGKNQRIQLYQRLLLHKISKYQSYYMHH